MAIAQFLFVLFGILGIFLFAGAFVFALLVAVNIRGLRDILFEKVGYLPGFRSGTWWKAVIGSFGYVLIVAIILISISAGLQGTIDASPAISATSLNETEIQAGESIAISGTVKNTGNESGMVTVDLLINGKQVDSDTPILAAGEKQEIKLTRRFDEAGEYGIKLNNVSVGTLTVQPAPTRTATPTPTTIATSTAASTSPSTPAQTFEVEQMFRKDGGLFSANRKYMSVDVSEDGSTIVAGSEEGAVLKFDGSGEGSELKSLENSPQVEVSNDGNRVLVTDTIDDQFYLLEDSGNQLWTFEFQGDVLFATRGTSDFSTVAAGANKLGGCTVGLSEYSECLTLGLESGNEILWQTGVPDGRMSGLAISEDGQYIVVGRENYLEDGDVSGQNALHLFNRSGGEEWSRLTGSPPISVYVQAERNTIIAGLDDGSVVAYGLDGDLKWENEGVGGFNVMSEDGSTIVGLSDDLEQMVALSTEGEVRWRTDSGYGLLGPEQIDISDDGNRVIASYSDWESSVVIVYGENGEELWKKEYDTMARVSISGDGQTWSVATENALEVYRSNK